VAKTTKQTVETPVEVLDPVPEDAGLVQTDGSAVTQFLTNVTVFFRGAVALEQKANVTLAKARALKAPASAEEDAAVQVFIRTASADRKSAEDYWGITTVFHGIHRRLTAARTRSTAPLEEAAKIAQQLHNRYVDDAKRAAQAEERRLQREADERAKAQRDAELEVLEQQQRELEEKSEDLSDRERVFVAKFYELQNGGRAAAAAGYKGPDYEKVASRLLSHDKIRLAINAHREAKLLEAQATARRSAPLVAETVSVAPSVTKVGTDVTTWSGEVVDLDLFLANVLDPVQRARLGIPSDLLTVYPVKLNEYARALQGNLDRWPGLRATSKTTTR